MASWGSCDFSDLEKLEKQLEKMTSADRLDNFFEECAKELAARLLEKVQNRTPVSDAVYVNRIVTDANGDKVRYKRGAKKGKFKRKKVNSNKTSGNLKKGWRIKSITKVGDCYQIRIINPVEYASYVEYGHRQKPGRFVPAIGKRLKKNWVDGKFMLTISEQEIKNIAPRFLEKRLKEYLQRCFL